MAASVVLQANCSLVKPAGPQSVAVRKVRSKLLQGMVRKRSNVDWFHAAWTGFGRAR